MPSLDQEYGRFYDANMSMGERLKAARERAKMTQAELGKKLRISTQTISNWERGKNAPTMDNLEQIAQITGADHLWLISGNTGKDGAGPEEIADVVNLDLGDAISKVCYDFMQRNGGKEGAEKWLAALAAVLLRRGAEPKDLGIHALDELVEIATELLEAGWRPENLHKSS